MMFAFFVIPGVEGSNHRWELPVIVEEEALLRWACGRHGHLVELLGVWNSIYFIAPEDIYSFLLH